MKRVCSFLLCAVLFVLPVLAETGEVVEEIPEIEVVVPGEEVGENEPEIETETSATEPAEPGEVPGVDDSGNSEEPPVDDVPPDSEEKLPEDKVPDMGDTPPEGDAGLEVVPPPADGGAVVDPVSPDVSALADGIYNVWSILEQTEEFTARAVPDDSPAAGYYMSVDTNLGSGELYVPAEYRFNSFSFDAGGAVMSLSNSSINALLVVGSSVYDVRFQLFSRPEYRRPSGSSWYWDSLVISDVTGGNVQVLRNSSDVLPWVPDDVSDMIIIAFLGVIVCKQFLSR